MAEKLELDDVIKVGEEEFSQDELNELLGAGRKLREIEKSSNQTIDDIMKSHGNRANHIGELKAQLEEAHRNLESLKTRASDPTETTPDNSEIAQAQAQLDKVMGQLGYAKKDDIKNELKAELAQEQAVNKLLAETERLEEKGNPFGVEELPKFVRGDMLKYMDEKGYTNPVEAYKMRYEKEIDAYKEAQIKASRPGGMVTDSTSSAGQSKQPKPIQVSDKNLDEMVREELSGRITGA